MIRVRAIFAVATLAFASAAFAADDNTVISPRSAARGDAPGPSATASSFNSLSLLLGVALAGVGGWMVWRNRRGTPLGKDMRALSVDETRSLGNRQYLVVASHEGKRFLLGVCPGQISFLSALPDATEDGDVRQ